MIVKATAENATSGAVASMTADNPDRAKLFNPAKSHRLDWRKQMSGTVAYALLVYTALQIGVTMQALSDRSTSLLPLFALIVLVAGIIPLFRHYERHWEGLSDAAAADPQLKPLFRRDQFSVWLFAIGLPFAITGVFKAIVVTLG